MKRSWKGGTLRGGLSVLVVGLMLFGAAGCGEETDDLSTVRGAITGGWTTLSLINGWQNYYTSNPPAIGIVDGVVTFRGAIKATNPTSAVPFRLSSSTFAKFLPSDLNHVGMRTVLSGDAGGSLLYSYADDQTGAVVDQVAVYQDGVSPAGIGAAAKAFTSLDGVSYDTVVGTGIQAPGWTSEYTHRQGLDPNCGDCGVYVKLVDGFVRFQGLLTKLDKTDLSGYLFTLPSSTYIPGQMVSVPVDLGGQTAGSESWGALTIYPDGSVYVNGNPPAANIATTFDGVWFSKTLTGNVALSLSNGWHAYSPRPSRLAIMAAWFASRARFWAARPPPSASSPRDTLRPRPSRWWRWRTARTPQPLSSTQMAASPSRAPP